MDIDERRIAVLGAGKIGDAFIGGLLGLCMMMIGMAPLVTGLFNEHPFD